MSNFNVNVYGMLFILVVIAAVLGVGAWELITWLFSKIAISWG